MSVLWEQFDWYPNGTLAHLFTASELVSSGTIFVKHVHGLGLANKVLPGKYKYINITYNYITTFVAIWKYKYI